MAYFLSIFTQSIVPDVERQLHLLQTNEIKNTIQKEMNLKILYHNPNN